MVNLSYKINSRDDYFTRQKCISKNSGFRFCPESYEVYEVKSQCDTGIQLMHL